MAAIDYNIFMDSSSQVGEQVIEDLRLRGMVIVKNVPNLEASRWRHYDNMRAMKTAQSSNSKTMPMSVGFKKYDSGAISFFDNHLACGYQNTLERLGLTPDQVPDLTLNVDSDTPESLQPLRESMANLYGLQRRLGLRLVDYIGERVATKTVAPSVSPSRPVPEATLTFSQAMRNSDAHKSRSLYISHDRCDPIAIYWHYDILPITTHVRNAYLNDKGEFVDPPSEDCGLKYRDMSGNDNFLHLQPGEVMLQAGIMLAVFTGGLLYPQAHCVVAPPEGYSRLSNVVFLNPSFDTPAMPFADLVRPIEEIVRTNPWDRDIISPTTNVDNHWHPNIPWVVLHQNQMQQHMLNSICAKEMPDPSSRPRPELERFSTCTHDVSMYHLDCVHSTHKLALAWPSRYLSDRAFFAWRADSQSGGVGQGTNTWVSPIGNVYLTCQFKRNPVGLPFQFFPGLVVFDVIKELLLSSGHAWMVPELELKWINDVFFFGKKICGVLTVVNGDVVTISMGVNIESAPVETATCLRDHLPDAVISAREFGTLMVRRVTAGLGLTEEHILEDVRGRLRYLNEEVVIRSADLTTVLHRGRFVGLNQHGMALLRTSESPNEDVTVWEGRMQQE